MDELGLNLLGNGEIVRLRTQIRPNAAAGPIEAVDLVAAVATVLANQVITVRNLGSGGIGILL